MEGNEANKPEYEEIDEKAISEDELEVSILKKFNELDTIKIESANDCCHDGYKKVDFDRCEDFKEIYIPIEELNCQSRLLRIVVNLKNVCKNRILGLSVVLVRSKNNMIISQKGKIIFTGTCSTGQCKEISKEFCFTLPGDLCDDPSSIDVKVIANYIYSNSFGALTDDSQLTKNNTE
ncbi:hypothetical protein [Lutispora thermophila]|uniref:Uncharacterized protein n=1 Tax=Lutispora thermophila DSM 19022 TaxID=1122184 RepID=A0A1M6GUI5_9FIRM|nr:hypothetical protein [Lutispora thermophila]SHJ13658.1 hypothetical protein SAMN02745176_02520 [Lutispora thermophila DSM 19022]